MSPKNVNFDFIKQGAVVSISGKNLCMRQEGKVDRKWDKESTVIVDTGNQLCEGIIDHHQPGSENSCVASILLKNPDKYIGHLANKQNITIVTHENPDLDAIASCFLILTYLEERKFSENDLLLASFVNEVDSGKFNMDPIHPVSIASVINAISNQFRDAPIETKNHDVLSRGFDLLKEAYRLMKADSNLWSHHFMDDLQGFDDLVDAIRNDADEYRQDLSERSETDTFLLFNLESNAFESVDFLMTKNPKSFLWKYWARGDTKNSANGDGFLFTCTLRDRNDNHRAIISMDPNAPFSLKGLGLLLDSIEIKKLLTDGVKKEALLENIRKGFHRNDPWFDGRGGFEFTIIGAPRNGSRLSDQEILQAIGAVDLWSNAEECLGSDCTILNIDKVLSIPEVNTFDAFDPSVLEEFQSSGNQDKERLWSKIYEACLFLLHTSSSYHDQYEIRTLRNSLFNSLLHFYQSQPKRGRLVWGEKITDLFIHTMPVSFLQKWLIESEELSKDVLLKALPKALKYQPEKEHFEYLIEIQNRHPITQELVTSNGNNTLPNDLSKFFRVFHVPRVSLEDFESNPLHLFHEALTHIEDLNICLSLANGEQAYETIPKIDIEAGDVTIDRVNSYQMSVQEYLQRLADQVFGNNYSNLRDIRSALLSGENHNAFNIIKRNSITKIVSLSYSELNTLLSSLSPLLDERKKSEKQFRDELDLLLCFRRVNYLLNRYCVYLRLKVVNNSTAINHKDKQDSNAFHFIELAWNISIEFNSIDNDSVLFIQIKQLLILLNKMIGDSNKSKDQSKFYSSLFKFYSTMLEELETDISRLDNKTIFCFEMIESLKQDGDLFTYINEFPLYFKHIYHEILISLRSHYRFKIDFLQSLTQSITESELFVAQKKLENRVFFNTIFTKTVMHEWSVYREQVLKQEGWDTQSTFFKKYFHWQKNAYQYLSKNNNQKEDIIFHQNASFRSSQSKAIKHDIKSFINAIPPKHCNVDFKNHLSYLKHQWRYENTIGQLPLQIYYDALEFLTNRSIQRYDVPNIAQQVKAFSIHTPFYIKVFTNMKQLRLIVISFIGMLFLMGVFDPGFNNPNNELIKATIPQHAHNILGNSLFIIASTIVGFFWTIVIGLIFLFPVIFIVVKFIRHLTRKRKCDGEMFNFIKQINRIEAKQNNLLYVGFLIPLILIVVQMARQDTIELIIHFEGFRLFVTFIILLMLTFFSIYIDIQQKNPKKVSSWVFNRAQHMFWLYSLQGLIVTIFLIDFLFRFQLPISFYASLNDLNPLGIYRLIVIEYEWFDIYIMPHYTVIITNLSLFISIFVNRIFSTNKT